MLNLPALFLEFPTIICIFLNTIFEVIRFQPYCFCIVSSYFSRKFLSNDFLNDFYDPFLTPEHETNVKFSRFKDTRLKLCKIMFLYVKSTTRRSSLERKNGNENFDNLLARFYSKLFFKDSL